MSRRHPRLSECKTMGDLVRGGFAQAVGPTTETGTPAYGAGRLFTTGDQLNYALSDGSVSGGTLAFRFVPTWANTDGARHRLVSLAGAGTEVFFLEKRPDNTYYGSMLDGVNPLVSDTAAVAHAANTLHTAVITWTAGAPGAVGLSIDGGAVTPTSGNLNATTFTLLKMHPYEPYLAGAYQGPVIYSPTVKDAAWITALGALGFSDPAVLFARFVAAGDLFLPLQGDSLRYRRAA